MRTRYAVATLTCAAIVPVLAALFVPASAATPQRGGGMMGGGSTESAVMGGERAREMTPFERFADRLRLDQKEQVPQAIEIFNAGAAEARPVGVELLQLRQRILNIYLSDQPAELQPAMEAYTAAATKMAAIEAATFAKVFAILKPNQHSRAPQAFELMAGFYQAGPARGGRGGQP
jgi:hypothetical protein